MEVLVLQRLYNFLKIRPGKSTLFAMINDIPLFALPGPPPAVHLLFHELVVPGLDSLQGVVSKPSSTGVVDAVLTEPVRCGRTAQLVLKTARATVCDGQVQVRPTKRLESANAILHLACPVERQNGQGRLGRIKKNQRVKVRLIRPLMITG